MSLFRRSAPPSPVVVDDFCRNAAAHSVIVPAAAGDVATVRAAIGGTAGEERALVVEAVVRNFPLPVAVEWTEAEPTAADAWLVRAGVEGRLAADARGSGMAETLKTGQIIDFEQLMADSARSATRAAELAPNDPEPVNRLIRTCYAFGADDIEAMYHELRRRDPWHFYGLMNVVDLVGEKWYGARGEARALAEQLAADAPEGSLAPSLVADAVREQWLYFGAFEKNRAAAVGFITAQETKDAVDAAYARSLGSPAHQPSPMVPLARNSFALTYELGGRKDKLAEQMAALDGLATNVWGLLGDPATVYEKARRGK